MLAVKKGTMRIKLRGILKRLEDKPLSTRIYESTPMFKQAWWEEKRPQKLIWSIKELRSLSCDINSYGNTC